MPVSGSLARARRAVLKWFTIGDGGLGTVITVGTYAVLGLLSVWTWLYWELAFNCEASLLEVVLSGAYAVLRGRASSWLLLWPGRVLLGLGTGVVLGPMEEASQPRVTLSPYSYLTAVSPSRPPVRPRSCRIHHSTVIMTVAWRNRKHPLASHPPAPGLVPWLFLRTTTSVPPLTAA